MPFPVHIAALGLAFALAAVPPLALAEDPAGDAGDAAANAIATADAGVAAVSPPPEVSSSPDAFAFDESELPAPPATPAGTLLASAEPSPAGATVSATPASPSADPAPRPLATCPEKGDAIAVFTTKRELWLCVDGKKSARFEVALGQAGSGKARQGDRRTPVGTYSLGEPRRSAKYGTFIPIAYPTPEQAAHGRTGSDVGIHGPPRKLPEPGYPTTAYDWTLGCVATGSDADVEAIAAFVRTRQPVVVIR